MEIERISAVVCDDLAASVAGCAEFDVFRKFLVGIDCCTGCAGEELRIFRFPVVLSVDGVALADRAVCEAERTRWRRRRDHFLDKVSVLCEGMLDLPFEGVQ